LLNGLGVAARVLGRSWDQVAEHAERRLVELRGTWQNLYGLGLFHKTRGRFEDGRHANQRAFDSGGAEDESALWNLKIWMSMGNKIELRRFGLPEGRDAPADHD